MRLCGFVVGTMRNYSVAKARNVSTRFVCGAPAKLAGGKPRCCDHWPGVVS